MWTDEKEINFLRARGLFGRPWTRTFQQIDVARGTLRNVLEFGGGGGGGALVVGSTIAPADTADGARFDFAFSACELRVGALTVPLPPVGRGWGELLYLDDELRVQRDVRGDVIIARKVGAA